MTPTEAKCFLWGNRIGHVAFLALIVVAMSLAMLLVAGICLLIGPFLFVGMLLAIAVGAIFQLKKPSRS